MDSQPPTASHDSASNRSEEHPHPSKKAPSAKETIQALCGLVFIVVVVLFLKSCFFQDTKTSEATPIERKLALLEFGISAETDSPQAGEYKEHLGALAKRFEISETEVGNMTYSVVKDLKTSHGIETTTLEMLRAARAVAMSKNGDTLGKGQKNYSFTVASIAAQMMASR